MKPQISKIQKKKLNRLISPLISKKSREKNEISDEKAAEDTLPAKDKPLLASESSAQQLIDLKLSPVNGAGNDGDSLFNVSQFDASQLNGDAFPYISSLKVSKELNAEIPFFPFITNEHNEKLFSQLAASYTKPFDKSLFAHFLDLEVLNFPLREFFKNKIAVDKIFNSDRRQIMKKIIEKRIEPLEKEVQFQQRMEKLGLDNLIVADILPSWDKSPLPFKLMLDEELYQLKISSLKSLNQPQIDVLRKKVSSLLLTSTIFPGTSAFSDIEVMDIHKLSAKQINEHASEISPVAFIFISNMEVGKLDIAKLSTQQLEYLFACDALVKKLNIDQVNLCLKKIENKDLLSKLTVEQFKNIDFKLVDKALFQALIGSVSTHADNKIQALSADQIQTLKDFFFTTQWEKISDTQFQALDLVNIIDLDNLSNANEIFKAMTSSSYSQKAKERFPMLSLDSLYALKDVINHDLNYWQLLSEQQFEQIDFSKVMDFNDPKTAYKMFGMMVGGAHTEKAKLRISKLPLEKIYLLKDIINTEMTYWNHLSDKQFKEIDFAKLMDFNDSKITYKMFCEIVGGTHTEKSKFRISELTLEKIYLLKDIINTEMTYWNHLSNKQFNEIDFAKVIDYYDLEKAHKTFTSIAGPSYSEKAKTRIPTLTVDRLYILKDVLDQYWSLLSVKQFILIDFEKIIDVKDPKAGFKTFTSLLGMTHSQKAKEWFPKLTLERLYLLKDVLKQDKDYWTLISDEQFEKIDFTKVLDFTDPNAAYKIFSPMAGYTYTTKGKERIAKLSSERIYLLQEIFNEDKNYWKFLTNKQISLLDFGKIIPKGNEAGSILDAIIGISDKTERIRSISVSSIAILKNVLTVDYKKLLTSDQLKALK